MENGNRRKIRTAAGYKKKSIDVPVGVTNMSQGGDRNVMEDAHEVKVTEGT